MTTPEEDMGEIDEFAMFKARSLGVESEYLEMARVGLLRRSMRQRVPLAATKAQNSKALEQTEAAENEPTSPSYMNHNGSAYDHAAPTSHRSKFRGRGEENEVSCEGHLGLEPCQLQRAHSYRANRKSPRDNRMQNHQTGDTNCDQGPSEKLSRQRNMTMPARRKTDSKLAASAHATTENENLRSQQQMGFGLDESHGSGGQHFMINDRSVLRVRNFTTKDGSIVNRGDSIKIRKSGKVGGVCLPSPLGKESSIQGGNSITIPASRQGKVSPRSGSLKGVNNSTAKKNLTASLANSDSQRYYSCSATHIAAKCNDEYIGDDMNKIGEQEFNNNQIRNHRFSRQFQSHDEERVAVDSNLVVQAQNQIRLTDSSLSTSSSSIQNSKAARLSSRGSRHGHQNEESIELEYLGQSQATDLSSPVLKSPHHPYPHSYNFADSSDDNLLGDIVLDGNDEEGRGETAVGAGSCEETTKSHDGDGGQEEEELVVYKVAVLGYAGVGKTTLIHQMLTSEYLANNDNELDDDSPDKIVSVQIDGEESMLQFIDLPSGQGAKRKNGPTLADANLVVYSVTDKNSYIFAQTCLQDLRPAKRHNVVILVANKQDLVRNRIVSEEDGKSLANKRHCKFIEVSALLSHKVDDLLVGVTRQIRLRKATGGAVDGGRKDNQSEDPDSKNSDGGVRVGCLQRAAVDIFRRLMRRRRMVESSSCDDLFTP